MAKSDGTTGWERGEKLMNEYLEFLNSRVGASDSDVEALAQRFDITERHAAEVYRAWLETNRRGATNQESRQCNTM